jgi:hypothetical protein
MWNHNSSFKEKSFSLALQTLGLGNAGETLLILEDPVQFSDLLSDSISKFASWKVNLTFENYLLLSTQAFRESNAFAIVQSLSSVSDVLSFNQSFDYDSVCSDSDLMFVLESLSLATLRKSFRDQHVNLEFSFGTFHQNHLSAFNCLFLDLWDNRDRQSIATVPSCSSVRKTANLYSF